MIWSGQCEALMEYLEDWIPEERRKFMDQVIADLQNPDYHLYSEMYFKLMMTLNTDT